MYAHTCIHTYLHVYSHAYNRCKYIYKHMYGHMYVYSDTRRYRYICIQTFMCMFLSIFPT
jgi:hypothetical protein